MTESILMSKLRPADPRGSLYRETDDFGLDDGNSPSNLRSKHQVTKKIKKFGFRKKKYKSISDEMREELINCIQNEGLKIKHAAKKLRMNYSSAKSIFKIYRREGRLNKKIFKRRAEDLEDGDFEGTPMSDDLESSDNGHESGSPVVPKQEFSTPEVVGSLGDHASLKIVIQEAKEGPARSQNSPLLKREEIEQTSVSSIKESMEELKYKVKVQEELIQPNQIHRNFCSMEDLVKQRPFIFGDNSGAISSKDGHFKAMQQQAMFPVKLPTNFPPAGFIPNMEPLQIFGQNMPTNIHFMPQYNMGPMMANKMNPFFPNPYMQNLPNMQNMNGLEPFINYSLFNNYQHRMSSSSHNTSNHLN